MDLAKDLVPWTFKIVPKRLDHQVPVSPFTNSDVRATTIIIRIIALDVDLAKLTVTLASPVVYSRLYNPVPVPPFTKYDVSSTAICIWPTVLNVKLQRSLSKSCSL